MVRRTRFSSTFSETVPPHGKGPSRWLGVLFLAIGSFSLGVFFACSGDPAAIAPGQRLLSAAEYAALPVLRIADATPACPSLEQQCQPSYFRTTASSENGWVVVLGETAKRIQLWRVGPGDSLFRPLGRVGGGPGEYRSVTSLFVDSSGGVLALDFMMRTLLRYAPDGTPLRSEVIAVPDGYLHDHLTRSGLELIATDPRRRSSGDSAGVSVYVLEGGKFRRTFTLPMRARDYRLDELKPVPDAFHPHPQWARLPDGSILYSAAATHQVDRFGADGQLAWRSSVEVEPRTITEEDVQQVVSHRLRGVGDERLRKAIRERLKITPSGRLPAVTRIVALINGDVWVRESPRVQGDSVSWVVYDGADGAARGRVLLATDDDVLASRGKSLLFFRSDGPQADATLQWVSLVAN